MSILTVRINDNGTLTDGRNVPISIEDIMHIKVDDYEIDILEVHYPYCEELFDQFLENGITVNTMYVRSSITMIPEGLITEAGSIYANNSVLEYLPDNLVLGNLDICNSTITKLPENLNCLGLNITDTMIVEIPESCRISISLRASSYLQIVPDTITAESVTVNSPDTIIPVRHYQYLEFNDPAVLKEGISASTIVYVGSEPLHLPDSCRIMEAMISPNAAVYFQENTIITNRMYVYLPENLTEEEVDSMYPDNMVIPIQLYAFYDDLAQAIRYRYGETIIDPVHTATDYYHLLNKFVKLYSSNPKIYKITKMNRNHSTVYIALKYTAEDPDKKIVVADGIMDVYTSKKRYGNYIMYKLTYNGYMITDGTDSYHDDNIASCILGISQKNYDETPVSIITYQVGDDIVTKKLEDHRLNDVLPIEHAIMLYRTITRACSRGVNEFIDYLKSTNQYRDEYTIQEIIVITTGRFGNERFTEIMSALPIA